VITEELREELEQAAVATQQAYNAVRASPGITRDRFLNVVTQKFFHVCLFDGSYVCQMKLIT